MRLLVSLSKHRLSGLSKDVSLLKVHHFLSHVEISDAGFT